MRNAGRQSTYLAVRSMASLSVLSIFLLYIFFSGVTARPFFFQSQPDYSQYIKTSTLNISSGNRPTRILFVGDVHGRFDDLQRLLHKLDYDPAVGDTLIHTGDITTKNSLTESIRVLEWMAKHDVHGVRGNHDQAVIDWKGWRDWISSTSAGKAWLDKLDQDWEHENRRASSTKSIDPIEWAKERRRNAPRKFKSWWRRVPRGWKMFNEHYLIAASLEKREYQYLLSLPLVLHIPSIHTFTVHAGILASDISRSATDRRQPLAHLPKLPRLSSPAYDEESLRFWQESAILNDIPQNSEPWVMLNMRSILKDNTIIRRNKKGSPWTKSYNQMMDRCVGYGDDLVSDATAKGLPCMPSSVVYGHAAARGLDINRWSFGLDTGCAYGRKLTALVLDVPPHYTPSSQEEEEEEDDDEEEITTEDPNEDTQETFTQSQQHRIKFGDAGHLIKASIVDVDCSS